MLVVGLRWCSLFDVSCWMVVVDWLLAVVVVRCLFCVGVRCMLFLVVVCACVSLFLCLVCVECGLPSNVGCC